MIKQIRQWIGLVILLVVSVISGCAGYGRNFTQQNLEEIKIGVHTHEDVKKLLGHPLMTSGDQNGKEMWS